jgi:F-type H+-transporting ATPase subunit gamma
MDSLASLRHKIANADELESVVRTMKAMAASSIGQYENAVRSLDEYYRTVELGLSACLRLHKAAGHAYLAALKQSGPTGVIIFGSDQGLVGQFNDVLVEFALDNLTRMEGNRRVWAIGDRIRLRLAETSLAAAADFMLPNSIHAITPLVGQILIEIEAQLEKGNIERVYLIYHRPHSGAIYTPVMQQLLPLDEAWLSNLLDLRWPTRKQPQVMNSSEKTLAALVREYLFVSLFRACAESLASENASRLAAMQRAEKNIDEIEEELKRLFQRLRQSSIDAELFDLISGFEALSKAR